MGTMRAEVVRTRRVSAWPHRRYHRLQRSLPEWQRCEMKQHVAPVRQRYNVVMDLLNLVHDPDVFQGVQPTLAEMRPGFVKKAAGLVEVVVTAGHPCFAPEEVAAGLRSEDSPMGFFEQPVELGVLS